jgi:UPF0176 protein
MLDQVKALLDACREHASNRAFTFVAFSRHTRAIIENVFVRHWNMAVLVAAFYKFVALTDCQQQRDQLQGRCESLGIRGTILLATEGINGTIVGESEAIATFLQTLRSDPRFADLEYKEAIATDLPFDRLKVKVKAEIVTFGMPEIRPSERGGTYVEPEDWNALITDPDVTVIDTRNDYEVNIGTFQGAENPQTESFRDFPDYVQAQLDPTQQKKVAMFCTGGIRCEKASAYLLSQGFEQVYHLKGGILKYLETVPTEQSLWDGECFVFDQRVAVQQGLTAGSYELCWGCGHPISQTDKASEQYEVGICCPHCFDALTAEKRSRLEKRMDGR